MAGSRLTLALLILAALVVSAAIALDRLPELTSDLIAWASGDAPMSFDPALVSVEQLIEAVRKAGFQPSLKRPAQ